MTSPYTTPSAAVELPASPNSRALALSGVILLGAPLLGSIGTIIGMIRAFTTLKESGADPEELASDISLALISTIYGIGFGLIGVVLVSIALFRRSNREPWFLKSVTIIATLWCVFFFPLGVVVGIYLLVIFRSRKAEFTATNQLAQQDPAPIKILD